MQKAKYSNALDFPLLEYAQVVLKGDFDYVYPPGDDSYLMLSILHQQLKNEPKQYPIIAQVGCGSGVLIAHTHKWLSEYVQTPLLTLAIDLNYEACKFAQKYFKAHHLNRIDIVNTSVLNCIKCKPDLILCNPPYIPTRHDPQEYAINKKRLETKLKEVSQGKLQRTYDNNLIGWSWVGGDDGLYVVWRILDHVDWPCTLYLVLIFQNPLEEFKQNVKKRGWSYQVLATKHKYNELLYIVKLTRP